MTEGLTRPASTHDIMPPEAKKIQSDVEKRLKSLVFETFSTTAGQQLLDLLDDLYIRQQCWAPGAKDGYAEWRAGQNNIVLMLRAVYNAKKLEAAI